MTAKIAMLGVWHVHAKDHLASLRERPERAQIVAVWDRDVDAAREFGELYGIEVATDLDELLGRPDLDGVVVNSATADHVQLLTAAAKNGKHVFTEKVIAATREEVGEILAAVATADVTITVALQRLTEAFAVTIADLVERGVVGRVTSVRTRFSHSGASADWLPSRFYDPVQAQGGVLIDLAAHSIYLGMLFAGGLPARVSATLGSVTNRAVEDNIAVVMGYDNGTVVVAESSFVAGFASYQVEVVGTAGTIALDSADLTVRVRSAGDAPWVDQPTLPRGPEPIEQFLDAIAAGKQDRARLALAADLTTVVEAAYAAAKEGRTQTLAPVDDAG